MITSAKQTAQILGSREISRTETTDVCALEIPARTLEHLTDRVFQSDRSSLAIEKGAR